MIKIVDKYDALCYSIIIAQEVIKMESKTCKCGTKITNPTHKLSGRSWVCNKCFKESLRGYYWSVALKRYVYIPNK